ncbi:uncharacterized protein LOC122277796 [Carya illinoinensis]|uniref:C2H2-type domain-containing protein n=1 Tax=Carya illinoinensis TaxID=32201 RepID=A0A8T1PIL2_CARIL|nr:uncharacterized protein LOC122277796 [Carya illinoinensis]KAG6642745.1 hypothetical protein CIPAW_09G162100 [Carya illinoinensis]KAG6696722.1 hypothetical protein I3842_09G162800 [Carya illinoinensis]
MEDSKNGTGFEAGYDAVIPSSEDAAKVLHGSVSLMETFEFKNKEPAGNSKIVEVRTGIEEEIFKNRTGDHGIRMRDLSEKDQFYSSEKGAAGHDDQYKRILHSQPVARPKTKKIKCLKPKVYAASSPKSLNYGAFKTGAASSGGGEHQCFCCFKKFPTLKSLCGHMRFHPQRNWKGIRPSDPSSTAFSAAHEDRTGLIPKWSRTSRRGRNSLALIDQPFQPENTSTTFRLDPTTIVASTHIPTSVLRTQDLSEEQKHLMRIEKVENQTQFLFSERVASSKQMMELQPESKSYSRLMIDGKGCWRHASTASDESKSSSSSRVPSKKATECKYEFEQLPIDLKEPNLNVHERNEKMIMAMNMEMMRMNNWKPQLRPFEPQIQKKIRKKAYEYTYKTSSKTFQSFQALGGHRSGNHKDHNSTKAVETSIDIQSKKDIANPMEQVKETKELGEHASLHICNICYKSYPTGQALGGHKKRHWAAARSAELARASSKAKAEDSGSTTAALTFVQSPLRDGATQAAGRKVLHFDLNESYVEEA